MPTDEKFFAWLDGELDADEAARIEAEVTAHAKLGELAAQHRAMEARLKTAFDTVLDAPVPAALAAELRDPQIIDFGAAAPAGRKRSAWRMLPLGALTAATLAIGVLVGTIIPHGASGPVEVRRGHLYAAAALDRALDTQLASAPGGDLRIELTFRDRSGAICRSFIATSSSGLACRDDGRWALHGLLAAPEGQSNAYRMASGTDPALASLIASSIAGEPFDAAAERAARDRGWR
jgi:hypothetical protein